MKKDDDTACRLLAAPLSQREFLDLMGFAALSRNPYGPQVSGDLHRPRRPLSLARSGRGREWAEARFNLAGVLSRTSGPVRRRGLRVPRVRQHMAFR